MMSRLISRPDLEMETAAFCILARGYYVCNGTNWPLNVNFGCKHCVNVSRENSFTVGL